jgi:hypothetical protein
MDKKAMNQKNNSDFLPLLVRWNQQAGNFFPKTAKIT